MSEKQKILDFIRKQTLTVISTVGEDEKPESAVVGMSETDKLELVFGTSNKTRKYKNLLINKNVSFVIGWDLNEKITIQYEGIAEEVEGKELEECKKIHISKNPFSKKFADNPDQRFFKVAPKWIRYSDLSKFPNEIFEITFS